jgi:phosphoribosylglycinamide formyltransferase-1
VIRLGVLASGGGTNLQALIDAAKKRELDAEVAVVLSDVAGSGALQRARAAGIAAEALDPKDPRVASSRQAFDALLAERLRHHRVDLVCLAGYMRLLGPAFLEPFGPGAGPCPTCPRVMNVHPGLLPSFPGLKAQEQALRHGARFAGCTVHFVDGGVDTGPIIIQAVVAVREGDTVEKLSARILAEEHRIYPQAVRWFAQGRLQVEGRRVQVRGASPPEVAIANPAVGG